ncbi:TPA: CG2 omega domain protein [Photobacterium damselae]|uniref:CG2 omega domain protein n=1 Tax=Photobacterium damselae TaxID=38293 RepID=UPI00370B4AE9
MKFTTLLFSSLVLITSFAASADIKISGDGFEFSKDCIKLSSDNISIKSDDCYDHPGNKDKNHSNRSIHGDNNPGKGHDKDHHKPEKEPRGKNK